MHRRRGHKGAWGHVTRVHERAEKKKKEKWRQSCAVEPEGNGSIPLTDWRPDSLHRPHSACPPNHFFTHPHPKCIFTIPNLTFNLLAWSPHPCASLLMSPPWHPYLPPATRQPQISAGSCLGEAAGLFPLPSLGIWKPCVRRTPSPPFSALIAVSWALEDWYQTGTGVLCESLFCNTFAWKRGVIFWFIPHLKKNKSLQMHQRDNSSFEVTDFWSQNVSVWHISHSI